MYTKLHIIMNFLEEYEPTLPPKDYCELWWWERKLLGGSPKPDRSKGRSQTKCRTLVLQVEGWAWC